MGNYVKVYRGTADEAGRWSDPRAAVHEADTGIHWTSDPTVAYHFARSGGMLAEAAALEPKKFNWVPKVDHPNATILEGWAHKGNIVQPGSREWANLASTHGIVRPNDSEFLNEHEVTIRPGSRIHVSKVHHIGSQFKDINVTEFGVPRLVRVRNLASLRRQ